MGLGLYIVTPVCTWRKRHEYRFDSPLCLQAKYCPTVINEIELRISSASQQLPAALVFTPWLQHSSPDNWQIRFDKRIASGSRDCEVLLRIASQVIKEDSSNTTRFIALSDEEVLITPFL